MDLLTDPQIWISFLTLTALEIVLGVDNIIFISIITGRLPQHQQQRGRMIGLSVAMGTRILLLLSINWVRSLTEPLFEVFEREITGEGLILLLGGAFLIAKATHELHENLEGPEHEEHRVVKVASFASVIAQIAIIDIVFSIDSVITAVGLAEEVAVMIAAVVVAVVVMMVLAGPISEFVEDHPTLKVLALSFLILIGVSLVAEGLEQHIPKGYIYFAMAFSVLVEMLNLRMRSVRKPVHLHQQPPAELEIDAAAADGGGSTPSGG
ncbi:MAG: TerC family protein [Actinomycetota bacterium]|nr:TerC family protein [Actinomycetota bacterium]